MLQVFFNKEGPTMTFPANQSHNRKVHITYVQSRVLAGPPPSGLKLRQGGLLIGWGLVRYLILTSNGNDIEAKRNEASIIRHFLYQSETNKLILKL